jgi:hypothetical protein
MSYLKKLFGLAFQLIVEKPCFTCPFDCDCATPKKKLPPGREGIIFLLGSPIVTVKREKFSWKSRKPGPPITKEKLRSILFGRGMSRAAEKYARRKAAQELWKTLGY